MLISFSVQAADFTLYDLDKTEHKLSDYRGKWVVVNYWATWCPPCVEEMPELDFFHQKHKDSNAVVLGVNFENAPLQKVRQFIEDAFVSYPILLSEPEANGPLGNISALPTTFFVSPEGKVVKRKIGKVDMQELEQIIQTHSQ